MAIAIFAGSVSAVAQVDEESTSAADAPFAFGEAAIVRLGDRLDQVAGDYGLSAEQFRGLLRADATLGVSQDGQLVYVDPPADVVGDGQASSAWTVERSGPEGFETLTEDIVFSLASHPGADHTIFLDFGGATLVDTRWNEVWGRDELVAPPWSLDDDTSTWSARELQRIFEVWEIVAEDMAPWDINVTTIDPGLEALQWTSDEDTQWGIRILHTQPRALPTIAAGVAYVGSFGSTSRQPALVMSHSPYIGQISSHELGHTLFLAHDGRMIGSYRDEYYGGHGTDGLAGVPSWGPIMGVAPSRDLTQWSLQEYPDPTNGADDPYANYARGPDDIAIMSSASRPQGFELRPDDHGDTTESASWLADAELDAGVDGIIGTRDDLDVFRFRTRGGRIDLRAAPLRLGVANLDVELTLRDHSGAIVVRNNVLNALDASFTVDVGAGSYTVEIDGVGAGNPATFNGYSDYASLGSYTLTGSIENMFAGPDLDGSGEFDDDDLGGILRVLVDDADSTHDAATGDLDGDGSVSLSDAQLVAQCFSGVAVDALCWPGR